MHVQRDQRAEGHALQLGQVPAHQLRHVEQLLVTLGVVLAQLLRLNRLLRLLRPVDLVARQDDLARPLEDPLRPRCLRIVGHAQAHLRVDRRPHHALHVGEPVLHRPLGTHLVVPLDPLALAGEHHRDLEPAVGRRVLVKGHLVDRFKALAQMRLDRPRVFGLRQDLQQLLVGEEVESRERLPLSLQVVRQPLLHLLERLVGPGKDGEEVGGVGEAQRVGVLGRDLEALAPLPVARLELGRLGGQLFHDVRRAENGLQVHPVALAVEPLLQDLRHLVELDAPIVEPLRVRLLEGREAHRLRHDDVVIQPLLDVVRAPQDIRAGFAVGHDVEAHVRPLSLHLVQSSLDRILLPSPLAGLDHLVLVRLEIHGDDIREAVERLPGRDREAQIGRHGLPMALAQPRVAERRNDGHDGLEVVDLCPDTQAEIAQPVVLREHL